MALSAHQLCPPGEPPDEKPSTPPPYGEFPPEGDDLPYRVEVWDDSGEYVEQVVAVSVSPAIGYAAYFAATREFPGRPITLRHKSMVISRWTGKTH
jgi:hypothetical protein